MEYDENDIGKCLDLDCIIATILRLRKEQATYDEIRYRKNHLYKELGVEGAKAEMAKWKWFDDYFEWFFESEKKWLFQQTASFAEVIYPDKNPEYTKAVVDEELKYIKQIMAKVDNLEERIAYIYK